MKYFLYLFFMLCAANICVAQPDTSAVEVRTFDRAALEALKNDREFYYDNIKEPTLSWWDRFWIWFWWKVNEIMQTKSGRTTVWTVLFFIAALIIAYAVFRISKINRMNVFASDSGKGLNYTIGQEDIHQISFETAIQEAIENKNFRLAVRLMYLQTLKILADKNLVEWKINKTNNDYVREVSAKPWQSLFSKLTYQFEYAWYGETKVTPERFEILKQEFKQLHNLV